jgi:hypothetical protein
MTGSPHRARPDRAPGWIKQTQMQRLLKHVPARDIPSSEDLFPPEELEDYLDAFHEPPLSVIAVGDTMLGDRATKTLAREGPDYAFLAVRPLLRRAPVVLANLEGPLARESARADRRYSYKVDPDRASPIVRAGINLVNLANNHALDCGCAGLLETLEALALAGAAFSAITGTGVAPRCPIDPASRSPVGWRCRPISRASGSAWTVSSSHSIGESPTNGPPPRKIGSEPGWPSSTALTW